MIKKFISKALLSVVMDKKARQKLKGVPTENKKGKKKPSKKELEELDPPLKYDPEKQIASLSNALLTAAPPPPPSDNNMTDIEVEELVKSSLDTARHELEKKPKPTTERQALIQQALAIRNSKTHVLDDLSAEQKEKLAAMALHTFDPKGTINGKKGTK